MTLRQLRTTYVILAINVIVALLMFISGVFVSSNQAYMYLKFGAQYGPLVDRGEWYRMITAMFVHGGFLHLLFNSYALFYFGLVVEAMYGTEKFACIYFASGISSGIATHVFYHNSLSVGASGAIFGLVGLLFAAGFRKDTPFFMRQYTGFALLPMILFNIVYGFIPGSGINNAAHIGGFLAGLAFGYFTKARPAVIAWSKKSFYIWRALAVGCGIVVAISFILLSFSAI